MNIAAKRFLAEQAEILRRVNAPFPTPETDQRSFLTVNAECARALEDERECLRYAICERLKEFDKIGMNPDTEGEVGYILSRLSASLPKGYEQPQR
jgi:hypothetical protein